MKELTIFLLTSYGITNIMVFSYIFEPVRNFLVKYNPKFLGELINCPMCLSVWVGGLLSYLLTYLGYSNLTPFGSLMIDNIYVKIFLDACITSGAVWLIHTIQEYFEK